jgi:hypothetical protein
MCLESVGHLGDEKVVLLGVVLVALRFWWMACGSTRAGNSGELKHVFICFG